MLLSGFPPVARRDARVLILGSMPSEASLAEGFYYAHPANAFWWLLAGALGRAVPEGVAARRRLLFEHRIALWDVVHRCRRRGSLDAAIERGSLRLNDFAGFLARHPRSARAADVARLLEAMAPPEQVEDMYPAHLFEVLAHHDVAGWPAAERRALHGCLTALADHVAFHDPDDEAAWWGAVAALATDGIVSPHA